MARVEVVPKLDGRNMIMVLAPDKRAQAAQAKRLAEEAATADGDGSRDPAPAGSGPGDQLSDGEPPAARPTKTDDETERTRRCPR